MAPSRGKRLGLDTAPLRSWLDASTNGAVSPATTTGSYAAVDLGSNSFHMVVARWSDEHLAIVDRLRERTALAAGLDDSKQLDSATQDRALACLRRFGERLRGMPAERVRAIGTSALRMARNARGFLAKAEQALGHEIEIVSGLEEARLIYLGVAHDLSDDAERRLVVDVGGGSTEIVLGERFEPLTADSLHMGCINWTRRWFPDGVVTRETMRRARLEAELEVQPLQRAYKALGWEEAVGSSGTALALAQILRANGWSDGVIDAKGLRRLRKALIEVGRIDRLHEIPGLEPERAPVIAGGLAILSAILDTFGIESMVVSQGALREGAIYDLLGRHRHEDVRDRAIRRFSERHGVDLEQASRIKRTALALFEDVREDWGLEREFGTRFLGWASRLHEAGLSISHQAYHRHGAYMIEHSDMAGFSREDQLVLATLVEGHRRKFPPERWSRLVPAHQQPVLRLCLLLRLAVLLERSRGLRTAPMVELRARRDGYGVGLPAGWLDENPLTALDLEQEAARLAPSGHVVVLL